MQLPRTVAAVALTVAVSACSSTHESSATGSSTSDPTIDDRILEDLRRFESDQRARANFGALPPSDHRLGADPYAIAIASPDRYVGLLRGADAVVLLDKDLHEIARADAPPSPVGLAIRGDVAFVVGERSSAIHPLRIGASDLQPQAPIRLPEARTLRDIAAAPSGALHVVDPVLGHMITLIPDRASPRGYQVLTAPMCDGASRVARTKSAFVINCFFEHRLLVWRASPSDLPEGTPVSIRNDGPLWSFAALEEDGGLTIASGGVEDKPLDRTHGSFENIDSFVYVDRVTWRPDPTVTRLAAVNVSELGVIVPKALDLQREDAGLAITATGFGGESFASIHLRDAPSATTSNTATAGDATTASNTATAGDASLLSTLSFPLPPGTNAFVVNAAGEMVIANPLLDRWALYRTEHIPGLSVAVPDPKGPARSAASRLGEALIFTSLMAPWNSSAGPLSRFTCETCHFEGAVDGRTHATGRGDIRATTKPLLGLFNNRPHFSRALDPDLSSVAHNEFRVAGARSDHEPIFDLTIAERPWLADLGVTDAELTSIALRRAIIAFLIDFTPRTSSLNVGRVSFLDAEQRGAELFRDNCERCHEARLSADVAGSRQPFDAWERLLFSDNEPIVWGRDTYEKTGVVPYVHDKGARVPSLRRLHRKRPYFTNGTAKSLADVLARARFSGDRFFHDAAPNDASLQALTEPERVAIEAFLNLL